MEVFQLSSPQVRDRVRVALEALRRDGFALIEDVLDAHKLGALRRDVYAVAGAERLEASAWYSNGNQRVFNLLNRGERFVRLIDHPLALEVVSATLGPEALLSSMTANIAEPNNVAQLLHADQQYVTEPWSYMATLNVVWLLDDFTSSNGGTAIVPGSHVLGRRPVTQDIATVDLTGKAGSVALLDGRVWHGTGQNCTADVRRGAIFSYYCLPFLRQQENVHRSLVPEVRKKLTPEARRLLGFNAWEGLGVVDGIPREWMGTKQRSGPVNSDGLF